ncbi:hypothetical protein [Streptococcus pneumoniae]|uniref:hypothetical protein n=1 Tax=Streptococcus pneumoniae TaxID=1313 RepID=UPI0005E24C60|nr:hypothetical protein [Streptococcus pneumoniae]CIY09883.1 chlorohydrolase [Streptococcus pneumoniae]COS31715.1 chlorohydrolase [Streptococcus pneumoniae]
MKIKEQTRKLAAGCSKHCFEVVDKTDEVSSKHCFEVVDRTVEEIFEEYKIFDNCLLVSTGKKMNAIVSIFFFLW